MRNLSFYLSTVGLLVLGLFLVGCGGGGTTAAGTRNVTFYLTDSFRDDYSQAWFSLFKAEVRDTSGNFTTIYNNDSGLLFDALRLSDDQGSRYAVLSRVAIRAGTYDRVRLTLGPDVVVVPKSGTDGQNLLMDDSLPKDGSGRVLVEFNLAPPLSTSIDTTLVIDFNLAEFIVNGNRVIPSFRRGSGDRISDDTRHETSEFRGVVTELTATSFVLQTGTSGNIPVGYGDSTIIIRDSNGARTTLANGQNVQVKGIFLPGAGFLTALRIKVEDNPGGLGEPEASGKITQLNLETNRMVLVDIFNVQGFVPQGSTLNVVWDETTIIRRSGVVVPEAQIANFPFAEVKGTYDAATNTLTAKRITLEDDAGGGNGIEAQAKGRPTEVDLDQNRMVLTELREIQGFIPPMGTVVVRWNDDTLFLRRGDPVDETALNQFPFAEVKGFYDQPNNTLMASRIKLDDD